MTVGGGQCKECSSFCRHLPIHRWICPSSGGVSRSSGCRLKGYASPLPRNSGHTSGAGRGWIPAGLRAWGWDLLAYRRSAAGSARVGEQLLAGMGRAPGSYEVGAG
jgi:hypothetical protein